MTQQVSNEALDVMAQLRAESESLRRALDLAALSLAIASDTLDSAGMQVAASDAHQAHQKARAALSQTSPEPEDR